MNALSDPVPAPRLHPLLAVAGVAVTLFSVVGIASLSGLLPLRDMPTVAETAPSPVSAPAPSAAKPVAPAAVAATPVKPAKRKAAPVAAAEVALPPAGAGVPPDYVPPVAAAGTPAASCAACGVVTDIRQIAREGEGSGLGAVAGGLVGGVLGNSIGRGDGRSLATLAGIVGGGLLGNTLEKKQRQSFAYQVTVRMEDGGDRVVESAAMPTWRVGDRIRLVDGDLVPR